MRSGEALILHEDRYFDPDPAVLRIARELYAETAELPIIAPHGHVDPALLATNDRFVEPTSLIVAPDHYILRLLYSRGVGLEHLGVPRADGGPCEQDPRKVWRLFAEHYCLFRGTPTGCWLDYELHELFGVRDQLSRQTADQIYDQIQERLEAPEYRPRALFERFRIEVLATTDRATDNLPHHQAIRSSGWRGRVIPTFRPDRIFQIARSGWPAELDQLGAVSRPISSYDDFLQALRERRSHFQKLGATATDHGVLEPYTVDLSPDLAAALFGRALRGEATAEDQRRFEAGLLVEMARMSCEDGLVMQLHAGALRDHNRFVAERFGSDLGGDIPIRTEFTRNLQPLLQQCGNDPRFTLVLFTLDESTYARELAPLAGHYPAVRLGPPWWFHDSIEGMKRFRAQTSETATIWNTAGFNDDTRAFCSIPARHDLARRMDANYLAGLIARHIIGMSDGRRMARALAYDLPRETYRLTSE